MSKILKVVQTMDHEKISMNRDETSPIANKITNDTWNFRFDKIISEDGYNTGRKIVKKQDIKPWLDKNNLIKNPVFTVIENKYLYNGVTQQNLFVDFVKLKFCPILRQPINYFTLMFKNEGAFTLYNLLRKENYYIETKTTDNNHHSSIIPEMILRIMDQIYNSPLPDIEHILFMAQDSDLICLVNYLHNMKIKTTLAISRTRPVSNYYLNQFDEYIDMIELMNYAEALSERRPVAEK